MAFTERLRSASKKEHSVSDGLVAARLILTTTDMRSWAKALASFWYCISAIEDAIASSQSSDLGTLREFLPRVERRSAYQEDLTTFYGSDYKRRAGPPKPEVQTYLERIKVIAQTSPHLLIAHAYTQHMATLAGGQSLRTAVRRSLQMAPQDPGTAVFEFKELPKKLKEDYKALINSLEDRMGIEKATEIIQEHRLVFKLNNSIIRSFPLSVSKGISGFIKLIPVEILLIVISLLIALVMVWYTRSWVVIDPDGDAFSDPDFVQH